MACHGGFSLDETKRRSWYKPEAILGEVKLGMTFADIGCGDGFFSILAAKSVGEKGKVYAVDIVFFSMDLDDFADPQKVLRNAKQMLKPDGRLVDLDWKKIVTPFGPPVDIRFSEQHASALISAAGFTVTDVKDAGPYHYVLTAKP